MISESLIWSTACYIFNCSSCVNCAHCCFDDFCCDDISILMIFFDFFSVKLLSWAANVVLFMNFCLALFGLFCSMSSFLMCLFWVFLTGFFISMFNSFHEESDFCFRRLFFRAILRFVQFALFSIWFSFDRSFIVVLIFCVRFSIESWKALYERSLNEFVESISLYIICTGRKSFNIAYELFVIYLQDDCLLRSLQRTLSLKSFRRSYFQVLFINFRRYFHLEILILNFDEKAFSIQMLEAK